MMTDQAIAHDVKEANTDYPILQLLQDRWSPRVFTDTEPTDQELRQLFEAASWAASSYNQQPWRFIVARKGTDTYKKIYDLLSDFNQSWVDSPVLVLTAYKKTFDDGKENFHALHDLGACVTSMTIQAQSMGIALHQMAGVDFEKAKEEFNIPDDFHVATAITIGFYGGNPEKLEDDLQKQEKQARERKPQSEFVFAEGWGKGF
ncbi:MAG: nitroreductase family protein [Bacteroidota bacterium]